MEQLSLRDVRCFRGSRKISVKPLTFLIGENSTGKSTVLALIRLAWDISFRRGEPDFNEEPFSLGAFDEVSHFHGGQGKRARTFSIGYKFPVRAFTKKPADASESLEVEGTFSAVAGQPQLCELSLRHTDWHLVARPAKDTDSLSLSFGPRRAEWSLPRDTFSRPFGIQDLGFLGDLIRFSQEESEGFEQTNIGLTPEEIDSVFRFLSRLRSPRAVLAPASRFHSRPYAISPIRSKPKRTYDPLRESQSPGGDHVPMLLARLNATERERWMALEQSLEEYGKESGLFTGIHVNRFGEKKEATPFQLRIQLEGQRADFNLLDVGYGVSQVLPILVDCLSAPQRSLFLLQQPEIHLHPRAQAQLGTFLCRLAKDRRHSFVIETHSDFLLDRVRLAVRHQSLNPSDVSIVFFERAGPSVAISELSLDTNGMVVDPPESYRSFFINEEIRLLTGRGEEAE